MSPEDAVEIAKMLFGLINIVDVKEFVSYDDRNFYIKSAPPGDEDGTAAVPREFILKVNNAVDSENEAEIRAQNSMMMHLHACGIRCPVPLPDVEGQYVSSTVLKSLGGNAQRHAVRLITFLPGTLWDNIPQSEETLQVIGKFVGQVTAAMEAFHNLAAEARSHTWDLARVLDVAELTKHFEAAERREVVDGVLAKFKSVVLPRADKLRKAVIHGDINEQNLLLDPEGPEVTGLLDFGDILCSWQINEIAINMAYGMLKKEQPIVAASHLLAGYATERTVSEVEWEVLPTLVACRLAQSITLGNYSAIQDPSNKEYLLTTQESGWLCLKELWGTPVGEVLKIWKNAVAAATS